MKLPNTIISLIFNEIEEKEWCELFFLFMGEIEWKINKLEQTINNYWDCKKYDMFEKECENGNIFTISKINVKFWNGGVEEACKFNQLKLVKFLINNNKVNDWEKKYVYGVGNTNIESYVLYYACEYGHLNMVKFAIEEGAFCWDRGLQVACCRGHLNIIKLMIKKGANVNKGLTEACRGMFFIKKTL